MIKNFLLKVYIYLKKKYIGFEQVDKNKINTEIKNSNYNYDKLLNLIIYKNKIFKKKNIKYNNNKYKIFKDIFKNKKLIKILDVGGGGGHKFYEFSKIFKKIFFWYNLETLSLVKLLKKKFPNEKNIKHIDNLRNLRNKIDIILCDSSFQYIEKQKKFLDDLLALNSKYFYLSRTFMNHIDNDQLCVMQQTLLSENGPGKIDNYIKDQIISYPCYIYPSYNFKKQLSKNYKLIKFSIDNDDFIIINRKKYFCHEYLYKKK